MIINDIFAGESENMEFKEDIPSKSEKYMKTVVAFANGTGGKLIFGVEDKTLNIFGLKKDEVLQKMDAITNAIYDNSVRDATTLLYQEFRHDRWNLCPCFRHYTSGREIYGTGINFGRDKSLF